MFHVSRFKFYDVIRGGGIFVFGILVLILFILNFPTQVVQDENPDFSFTFSSKQAESFGLDWKKTYEASLDDFRWDSIRIPVYWDRTEPHKGKFNFDELDYQLTEAAKRGIKVTLAIGHKVPRWPECHDPKWTSSYSKKELIDQLFEFDRVIVERYKDHPALARWQVENELLFPFGKCHNYFGLPTFGQEIDLVRTLDQNHKILVTDSGEWTPWIPMAAYGDVLGSSLYREAWNSIFGYIPFPISPGYYQLRQSIVHVLFKKEVIVTELQGEPWGPKGIHEMTQEEMKRYMPLSKLQKNIEFAKKAGFKEIGLWGVEWWYFMKEQGDQSYWNELIKVTGN